MLKIAKQEQYILEQAFSIINGRKGLEKYSKVIKKQNRFSENYLEANYVLAKHLEN